MSNMRTFSLRKFFFVVGLICICTTSLSSRAGVPSQFRTIQSTEPSLSEITKVLFKQEGLGLSQLKKWQKQAKVAPYLPTLYIGYDHSFKESESLSINDNISVSGGSVTVGPEDNDYDIATNTGEVLRMRAVWRLDELVFNRNTLLIANERRDLVKLRNELSKDVYKIYEQRSLTLFQYLKFRSNRAKAAPFYAKYLLLTQNLDAMTGGHFVGRWWREKNTNQSVVCLTDCKDFESQAKSRSKMLDKPRTD